MEGIFGENAFSPLEEGEKDEIEMPNEYVFFKNESLRSVLKENATKATLPTQPTNDDDGVIDIYKILYAINKNPDLYHRFTTVGQIYDALRNGDIEGE